MKMLNKWVLVIGLVLSLLVPTAASAQNDTEQAGLVEANATPIEMADRLRQDGKIYVVVGCVLVVLAGLIFYLVAIDKKVSRLEKEHKN